MYNPSDWQKTYITVAASTVVFSGRGTLGGICVNTTAAGAITLYDGTSPFAILVASVSPNVYLEGIVISNGLTVNTAASPDITVKWAKG
jgi:hypothetical protein